MAEEPEEYMHTTTAHQISHSTPNGTPRQTPLTAFQASVEAKSTIPTEESSVVDSRVPEVAAVSINTPITSMIQILEFKDGSSSGGHQGDCEKDDRFEVGDIDPISGPGSSGGGHQGDREKDDGFEDDIRTRSSTFKAASISSPVKEEESHRRATLIAQGNHISNGKFETLKLNPKQQILLDYLKSTSNQPKETLSSALDNSTDRTELSRDSSFLEHDSGYAELSRSLESSSAILNFTGKYRDVFEDLQRPQHVCSKRALRRLREVAEQINDEPTIQLEPGVEVTQKELLCDLIDNQLLLLSGHPPYCTLCGRKKLTHLTSPCVYCGSTIITRSGECVGCRRMKVTTTHSHAIQNCTLQNMEKESGGPVIYSQRHGIVKKASDVTWHVLCSHCEHANDLNTAESRLECLRQVLRDNPDYDVEVKTDDAKLLLFASAFNLYRGLMVNVELMSDELTDPCFIFPLLTCFYRLKRYCQDPIVHPSPDIYFFLLPSYDVFRDIDQRKENIPQVSVLHDPYMRRIEFTHVATFEKDSLKDRCLYICFDRFHFVLPIFPGNKLELDLLSKPRSVEYFPNLARHQSITDPFLLLRNRQSEESFFPSILYRMAYEGANKLSNEFEHDQSLRRHVGVSMRPVRGIINRCSEESRKPATQHQGRIGERKKLPKPGYPVQEEEKVLVFRKKEDLAPHSK